MGLFRDSGVNFQREDFTRLALSLPKIIQGSYKNILREAESYLKQDEIPLHLEGVNIKGSGGGILLVSNQRIYFVTKSIGRMEFKQLPYATISDVSMKTFPSGKLIIKTVHEKFEITSIIHTRVKDVYRTIVNHTS